MGRLDRDGLYVGVQNFQSPAVEQEIRSARRLHPAVDSGPCGHSDWPHSCAAFDEPGRTEPGRTRYWYRRSFADCESQGSPRGI